MATENELQDNIVDANQIHTNEALGSGKIKVALVDPATGIIIGINWGNSSVSAETDRSGEVDFDIPDNATRAGIMVEQPHRVRAISFVGSHSISTIVLS